MQKIVTSLWFKDRVKEAVDFYVSLFEDAKITNITYISKSVAEMGGGKVGDVSGIEFELNGQNFMAINGGPAFTLSEAVSILVTCKTQEEIDRLWEALSADGEGNCGWCKDKYGLSWQIVPETLEDMLRDSDPVKADRVAACMLKMGKLNISELEKAYRGEE